jgi:CcdB protein
MAQLDVYKNPGVRTGKQAPYLVEVQGRFVDALSTCVVIPLVCKEGALKNQVQHFKEIMLHEENLQAVEH